MVPILHAGMQASKLASMKAGNRMQVISSYSEAGGVGKTTLAVSLAMTAAVAGKNVVLIDLDPRGAATKWLDAAPKGDGLHAGAILGNEDPEGWAEDLAVPTAWHERFRVIPGDRNLSLREKDSTDGLETRLKASLAGLRADVVVIDSPNRQGGPLIISALHASDTVVYASSPTQDGVDGVMGARKTINQYRRNMERLGVDPNITEVGVVVGNVSEVVMSRVAKNAIEELRETGMLLTPIVPARTIVQESRTVGQWVGAFRKGEPVVAAYTDIMRKVVR